jgi:hypothetical protein
MRYWLGWDQSLDLSVCRARRSQPRSRVIDSRESGRKKCSTWPMPQRPREHRIEDESRAAFAEALGEDYLYRTEVPDYSIDGGVEEFKDDHATGLRYLVQLKATDATGNEALARSLPVETLQYYGAGGEARQPRWPARSCRLSRGDQ